MAALLAGLLTFAPLALAAPQAPASAFRPGGPVVTTSGHIVGQASSWQPSVSEYLGIPFAQPPVGPLRFAAPKPFNNKGHISATKWGASCPANVASPPNSTITYTSVAATVFGILGQAGDTFDEDCLTLNVWSAPGKGEKAKAVMIWIYGGGFNTGNSRSPAYNGARLAAEQDVVVVSVNYRVNIFGFPGAPFLPDLNLGLLDQRLGVEWVRDNIAAFGGDPKRIVLFGESAGGGSVDYHSFAFTKDPIVTGYIPESGSAANIPGSSTNRSLSWYGASAQAGCGGAEAGAKTLECMRSKKWTDILSAIKVSGGAAGGMTQFGPTADGKVIFNDYAARRAAGNFHKAPMLVGNNNNEGGLSALIAAGPPKTASSPKSNARRQAAPNLDFIGCGPHAAALARRNAGVNAWRYLYSGEWPNQDIGTPGAWHGAEIGIVFGTTEYLSHRPDTEEEKKLETKVMGAWSAFAKDPVNGLVKLGWPVYDPAKPTLIRIGGPNSSEIAFVDRAKLDAGCPAA
ncbi:carboxylesterase [Trichodelitschia bisporula]|uniref:Carboxylic ester hydrolase n=1 Tax=Trichodelitschia bisporula TaxID=703511 RepID=A0A6G1I9D2_9PEZI|nr:carboxylesterase [Trichodelitschia bisporula]